MIDDPGAAADFDSKVGLCLTCIHGRPVKHPRGGDPYWRCGLSDTDKRFPKYPNLPVIHCIGYEPEKSP